MYMEMPFSTNIIRLAIKKFRCTFQGSPQKVLSEWCCAACVAKRDQHVSLNHS